MTSVFRIDGLVEAEIWGIGDREVTAASGRAILGRGDILQGDVEKTKLYLDHNNIPLRHANIAGWPPDKDERISLAQELAAAASLRLRT
jgi:hypothetical protein